MSDSETGMISFQVQEVKINKLDLKNKAVREAIHMFLVDVSLADFRRYEITEGLHKNMIAISSENLDRLERGVQTLRDHMDSYMKRKTKR